MAKKKKQHYVPKFYLRFFSASQNDKKIKICLKETIKTIQNADLEGQAQEDYFYGKDLEREEWFGNIEDRTSIILKEVIKSRELPKNKSDNYYWIWLFVLLQAYRTRANADEFNNVVDKTMKTAMKFDSKFKDFDFDKHLFAYDDATEKALDILLKSLPMMMDLQVKLLENNTAKPFITSDNPVSKYNQFLESRNFSFGHYGMLSKGLQIFYPLSPDLALVLYDPKVYKIGYRKQFSKIQINEMDVEFLNILTCLYANKALYGTEKVTDFQFEQIVKKSKKFQGQKKLELKQFEPVKEDDETESIIVQHQKTPYIIHPNFSFVRQTQHAKSYKMSGYYAEIRDERYRERRNRNY
ncbi:DUF4238 domain-containing protein [Tenacibaculum ovolyticum]|uniref:DUF4238 domain-containing protein n=1 Tax=Tenacibaculum ovolyticum TaxID=104270 RepID=UPI001F3FAFBD|nr:DUF4238 domain-containing protein [Tenacibaculum ovolyticum]